MGTVATATKIAGVSCIGPELYMAIYTVALETTDATGIQTIDLTADFEYVHSISFPGNDTLADNGYKYDSIIPTSGTAIAATTVQVSVHEAGADAAPLDPVTSTDLTAVGALQMIVFGKRA